MKFVNPENYIAHNENLKGPFGANRGLRYIADRWNQGGIFERIFSSGLRARIYFQASRTGENGGETKSLEGVTLLHNMNFNNHFGTPVISRPGDYINPRMNALYNQREEELKQLPAHMSMDACAYNSNEAAEFSNVLTQDVPHLLKLGYIHQLPGSGEVARLYVGRELFDSGEEFPPILRIDGSGLYVYKKNENGLEYFPGAMLNELVGLRLE